MLLSIVLVLSGGLELTCNAQRFIMSMRVYNKTVLELERYVEEAKALPGFMPGTEPRYFIHPSGTRVHGTIIVVHGFGDSSKGTRLMSSYLFRERFNVIAVNQLGAGRPPEYLPKTLLRDDMGFASAREELMTNPKTREMIADAKAASTVADQLAFIEKYKGKMVERLESALGGWQHRNALTALQLMKTGALRNDDTTRKLRYYFETEHLRHDAKAYTIAQLGDTLPGPRFVMGFSFGATYSTYAASRSGDIQRAVLLAPFFGTRSAVTADYLTHTAFAGSLDLIGATSAGLGAAVVSAIQASRDTITQRVREQTRVLCILAADDAVIDPEYSDEVCSAKLGGRSFVYPKELGLGHLITPETGSQYSEAMMRQVANFFLKGITDDSQFLVHNNETKM